MSTLRLALALGLVLALDATGPRQLRRLDTDEPAAMVTTPSTSTLPIPIPDGGRILFGPDESRGAGVLEPDGSTSVIQGSVSHFYWDPDEPDGVIVAPLRGKRIHSYRVSDGDWVPTEKWAADPVFSMISFDGGKIALVTFDRRGRLVPGLVRVMDRDRRAVRQLRFPDGLDRLGWAPDGRWLTVERLTGDLILWDPATSRTEILLDLARVADLLVPGTEAVVVEDVTWSPDARYFAVRVYLERKGDDGYGIAVGRLTGDIVRLIRTGSVHPSVPTWSPARAELAYLLRGKGEAGHRHARLYVHNVRTGRRRVIADDVSDAWWASWSPKGNWLLVDDWTRHRWLFVARDGRTVPYARLGDDPRWCCPASPPINVSSPVC